MRSRSSFLHLAATLLAVLLPLVVFGGAARAQTIDNIAQAQWVFEGAPYETESNLVTVSVLAIDTAITVYRPTADPATVITYRESQCGTTSPASRVDPVDSGSFQTASVTQSNRVSAGSPFLFQLSAPAANLDSSSVDRLDATLVSSTGDRETITIFETGENTGIFVGTVETHRVPPAFASLDCRLGVVDQGTIQIRISPNGGSELIVTAEVDVIASPFNIVFDSETGNAVSGARVTLVDALTGQPAIVFAEDGTTPWPPSLISGESIIDAAGSSYAMAAGQFWFPVVSSGTYRLVIQPPAPYIAPSVVSPEQLARLTRGDGGALVITDASYGESISLGASGNLRTDIPLDRPGVAVTLSKSASRVSAQPGDVAFYTIIVRNPDPSRTKRDVSVVDTPSRWLRYRPGSVRIDGQYASDAVELSSSGDQVTFLLGDIGSGQSRRITYAMTIRADAPPGQAVNRAVATDLLGRETTTGAAIEIERDTIAGRMTIIGRVTAGTCDIREGRPGIPGVRVVLEDGSFAITDVDGRYHFEGVVPGTHVVQASRITLPDSGEFIDCHRDTRSAGSATSRFAIGQGGSLVVADFHATVPQGSLENLVEEIENGLGAQGKAPAGNESEPDWLALGDGPDGWLAPAIDHNPRAPAIRVAIRHRKGQKIVLRVDGEAVNPLLFDGTQNAEQGEYAVSRWRGVPLRDESTVLSADIINSFGEINETIERDVFFTTTPAKVELVAAQSNLIADGRTNPVLAVRILDRNNRPLRAGMAGEFAINAPYESAEQLERQQLNQLTGLGASSARWVIQGNDGIAFIELAPTMVSGSLNVDFRFDDGEIVREQQLDAWIEPGDMEWTIVGLAEGSIGAVSVADNMERNGRFDSDLGDNARVALYAKGRVLGKFLVTLAYDSAKQEADQRLLGTLDPDAYYTVFGDASSRRFDAASRDKLYVRIETASFFALYGDFETGFDQTRLARYNRTATGLKGEARFGQFTAEAFAADIETGFRRDEIQGQGITGPYRLSNRAIIANSEQVTLEVRDRFRSEIIISSRKLSRFLDYDVDLLSGTITFKEPVLSRDFALNPQFVIVQYETEKGGDASVNAGLRGEWTDKTDTVRIGASAISDKGDGSRTNIAALDMRAQLKDSTHVRAELAVSERDGEMATAWLIEAQHQTGDLDILAYARSVESEFGVGQQNGTELGRTKVGTDARLRLDDAFSVTGSIWHDDSLSDDSQRRAAQMQLLYSDELNDLRVGIAHFNDRLADETQNSSTVVEAGATRRLFANKLEVSASTSVALDQAASADLPTRHRLGARYAITNDMRITALYEIAEGETVSARTLKGGFEVTPWQGAQAVTSIGKQRIGELGDRSFAAFGLSQTLQISPALTISATLDANRTLERDPSLADILNPDQPLASGGQFGQDGGLFEDFTAATLGAAFRKDRWSATARGEYRDGEFADRKGITLGAIRQLGEGSVVGSGLTWTDAEGSTGTSSQILDAALAVACRPAESDFAFLGKLEYRSDAVQNAVEGDAGPAGRTALLVSGDAQLRRLIASVSANWSPQGEDEGGLLVRRDEFGLFIGARRNFDRIDTYDLASTTIFTGADVRIGIGDRFEVGAKGTVRSQLSDNIASFSVGPTLGFVPADNMLLIAGYNVVGFRDEDFSVQRQTDKGFHVSVRLKLDADSFAFLGLQR